MNLCLVGHDFESMAARIRINDRMPIDDRIREKPAILLSSFRIFEISKYFEPIVYVQASNKSRKSGGALRPKSGSSGALFSPIRGSHESM